MALDGTLSLPYCGLQGPALPAPLTLNSYLSALYIIASSPLSFLYFSCPSRSFLLGLCVLCALCSGSSASRPSRFCSIQILWVLAQGSPPSGCPSLTPALRQPPIPRMRSQSPVKNCFSGTRPMAQVRNDHIYAFIYWCFICPPRRGPCLSWSLL